MKAHTPPRKVLSRLRVAPHSRQGEPNMRSAGVGILLLLAIVTSGCATKKHFKHQVTPTINRSNDLDQQAAGNSGDVLTVNDVIGKNVDALTARIVDLNQLSTGALRQAGA